MTLLDFARGPALEWSIYILVAGSLLRLVGVLLVRHSKDLSEPRSTDTTAGGIRTIGTRMWQRPEFLPATLFPMMIAYGMHIGLAIVVFFFVPHILFIERLTGLSWGGLPSNIVMVIGAITIAMLVALWIRRLNTPVLRLISNLDDHLSLLFTLLPVLTGMLAFAHAGLPYETMLALHILSVEALFIYFPLGKLFHAIMWIPSRFRMGAAFQRRGVRA